MGRANKNAGFSTHRGSTNPRVTVSANSPKNPLKYDIWVDITTPTAPVWNYWDGSAWQN